MTDPLRPRPVGGVIRDAPLRTWIQDDAHRRSQERLAHRGPDDHFLRITKESVLRKAMVGYGVVCLLRHARRAAASGTTSRVDAGADNFVVHVSTDGTAAALRRQRRPWNDVLGVSMISPAFSARLHEPSFVADIVDENIPDRMGRYLEVVISAAASSSSIPLPGASSARGRFPRTNVGNDCYLLGILLYELFSGLSPFPAESLDGASLSAPREDINSQMEGAHVGEYASGAVGIAAPTSNGAPPRKRSTVRHDKKKGKSYSTLQKKCYAPLQQLVNAPSSICLLVHSLIDGNEVYSSLEAVGSDIHLLVSDPDCYLCDLDAAQRGNMQLRIKEGKLYGREDEVSQITDAFCRVSEGKNEAIFVGGFSGAGKTFLVQSLVVKVDVFGGYVLTQKVDQMSTERPLLDVLSPFNRLCALIKRKTSPRELLDIANRLEADFESDFSALTRLLPNVSLLFPPSAKPPPTAKDAGVEQIMNPQNVCFTLKRFMRIVSSGERPVMLFMDDLQWAQKTSLDLVRSLLVDDARGPACFFFVGSYRSNEVEVGHPIHGLVSDLESRDVRTTRLLLGGLSREDLNLMVSDSLGIFPRMGRPLSDMVHAKTKGNPFFALQFLRSLLDRAVLKYSLRERRWLWDLGKVQAENITDNALYLLSNKMKSFPENVQLALKTLSCFGIICSAPVVKILGSTSQYPDFGDWLNVCIKEGCLSQIDGALRFVHDKVREAAYSLIPDNEKTKFHYNLGFMLYSVAGRNVASLGEAILDIVDQINYGIPGLLRPEMLNDVIELNFHSGIKAMNKTDYEMAQSYFSNAFSLIQEDYWTLKYEFCLRLYFLSAKAAYSCGNIEKASIMLKRIIKEGKCVEDKLDAYFLHVSILHNCEERDEAYTTCCTVLGQLGEKIPDCIDARSLMKMVRETGDSLRVIKDEELLQMKEMKGRNLMFVLKFYALLIVISYWTRPMMMIFAGCNIVRISIANGVCQDTIVGLIQYSGMIIMESKVVSEIKEACRFGRVAVELMKRFKDNSVILPKVYAAYYGFVAPYVLPLHVCYDNLRKGFEVGMSVGDSAAWAFYNSALLIRMALISGNNLPALLKEIDYHLGLMSTFRNKLTIRYLTAYRETVSTLIDRGGSTLKTSYAELEEEMPSNNLYAARHEEFTCLNKILQAFWLGFSQRCYHYAKKALELKSLGRHNRLMIQFYASLNSFRGVKNRNGCGSQFSKVRGLYKDAVAAWRIAQELSPMWCSNKVFLLEAEMFSFENKDKDARSSYDAAITASLSSKYVHDQGLACELAGLHCKKVGDRQGALDFFQQAKDCYSQWGSQTKVQFISQQMEILSA